MLRKNVIALVAAASVAMVGNRTARPRRAAAEVEAAATVVVAALAAAMAASAGGGFGGGHGGFGGGGFGGHAGFGGFHAGGIGGGFGAGGFEVHRWRPMRSHLEQAMHSVVVGFADRGHDFRGRGFHHGFRGRGFALGAFGGGLYGYDDYYDYPDYGYLLELRLLPGLCLRTILL